MEQSIWDIKGKKVGRIDTLQKKDSPRALRGRSGNCRHMLERNPKSIFSVWFLSHQAEREKEMVDTTITDADKKYSDGGKAQL